ncbi:MAG TPA: SUF system NifU family Fe-S cluster assembly protein [Gemmatimonadales bacterium]|nr:SUF system NifU family Fe-S cluster assembly protein [Gemmatimonadales bacterium]
MNDLSDLYQQVILDHNRNPRNFRAVPGANRSAEGYNPLCGDRISLQVRVDDDVVADVGFQGSGCAISKAAASLMTGAVQGKTTAEAETLFRAFREMLAGGPVAPGKLAAFSGVRAFPARVKCANLSWHTLSAALANRAEPVTTESPSD